MGGTFQRLVEQNHDVHVAYQTSGNIAVGDDEAIRYLALMGNVLERFDPSDNILKGKYQDMYRFLTQEKKTGDVDTIDILYLKGEYITKKPVQPAATTESRWIVYITSICRFMKPVK